MVTQEEAVLSVVTWPLSVNGYTTAGYSVRCVSPDHTRLHGCKNRVIWCDSRKFPSHTM
jgi:hypothetical protein